METSTVQPWKELARETVFSKYGRKIDRVTYHQPKADKDFDYYIYLSQTTACILALTEDNQVILGRQYRPGTDEILNDLPGGCIDEGESMEEGIARELLEETGYAGEVKFVASCPIDAYSSIRRNCFVATGCKKVAEPKQEETEDIEIVLMPLDEFRQQMRAGKMVDLQNAYLGLDYLGLL